jgi:hypothetical protein
MQVEQIYTGCLSQGSYYIISNGEAVIIDSQIGDNKIIRSSGQDLNLVKKQIKDGINSNEGVTPLNFGT